tara:strand:- start:463 stop:642 length:180 start_codon:yes stop_codon:yes gene_type:complete
MAKIERSPVHSYIIYISDDHMDGKWIPIHSKKDLLMLIKLASESLLMLEEEKRNDIYDV